MSRLIVSCSPVSLHFSVMCCKRKADCNTFSSDDRRVDNALLPRYTRAPDLFVYGRRSGNHASNYVSQTGAGQVAGFYTEERLFAYAWGCWTLAVYTGTPCTHCCGCGLIPVEGLGRGRETVVVSLQSFASVLSYLLWLPLLFFRCIAILLLLFSLQPLPVEVYNTSWLRGRSMETGKRTVAALF